MFVYIFVPICQTSYNNLTSFSSLNSSNLGRVFENPVGSPAQVIPSFNYSSCFWFGPVSVLIELLYNYGRNLGFLLSIWRFSSSWFVRFGFFPQVLVIQLMHWRSAWSLLPLSETLIRSCFRVFWGQSRWVMVSLLGSQRFILSQCAGLLHQTRQQF